MKKAMLVFGILVSLTQCIYGQDPDKSQNAYGVLFMAGGRYDNYRMCVASPAGVKGGTMADIMFTTKHRVNDHRSLTFHQQLIIRNSGFWSWSILLFFRLTFFDNTLQKKDLLQTRSYS